MDSCYCIPSFLLIGAQKCGTTWLSHMIEQHKEVCSARKKEIHYFNNVKNYRKGLDWYLKQFRIKEGIKAIGEYTPNYFWVDISESESRENDVPYDIPKLVHQVNSNIRLILCLRNPIDRAISAFYHHIRSRKLLPRSNFTEVMHKYGILTMGFYDLHLLKWLEYFSLNNFLILIYENDFLDSFIESTIKKVYMHLDVDCSFMPTNLYKRYNTRSSGYELHMRKKFFRFAKYVDKFTPDIVKNNPKWDIRVSDRDQNFLKSIYHSHNRRLEEIIGQKLPW